MGFSFKRAFRPPRNFARVFKPPKKIVNVVKKAVRYTGAVVTAPVLTAGQRQKAFGLTAKESKGFEKLAKVQRVAIAATAVIATGGAAAAAMKAGPMATKLGAMGAKAGAGGFLKNIFKKKGEQLPEQAEAVDESTTTAEAPEARDDAPEPFVQASAKPGNLGIFVEPPQSLSAQQAAPGAQIEPAGDWLDSIIKSILSFFGA